MSLYIGETLKFKGVLAGYEWIEAHVAKVPMSIGEKNVYKCKKDLGFP